MMSPEAVIDLIRKARTTVQFQSRPADGENLDGSDKFGAWANTGTPVPGFFMTSSGGRYGEIERDGQRITLADHLLYVPPVAGIDEEDRVKGVYFTADDGTIITLVGRALNIKRIAPILDRVWIIDLLEVK